MTISKQQAIEIFGSGAKLGLALGLGRSAISQWPEKLGQKRTDLVMGAALRLGKLFPMNYEIRIDLLKMSTPFPNELNQAR